MAGDNKVSCWSAPSHQQLTLCVPAFLSSSSSSQQTLPSASSLFLGLLSPPSSLRLLLLLPRLPSSFSERQRSNWNPVWHVMFYTALDSVTIFWYFSVYLMFLNPTAHEDALRNFNNPIMLCMIRLSE